MNAKKIIEQLMKQASDTHTKGRSGQSTDSLMGSSSRREGSRSESGSGVDLKSLLAGGGGALGMLLGSRRRRGIGGKALKYGAIAKVGKLAWNAWQDHKSSSQHAGGNAGQSGGQGGDSAREGQPFEQLQGEAQERRGLEILQAMIMAARADGHIDEAERAQLAEQIEAMGADNELKTWVDQQFKAPLDAEVLARQVDSPQAAREMYLVSVAMTDEQNAMERAWLDQLAKALGLDPDLAAQLERQAEAAA